MTSFFIIHYQLCIIESIFAKTIFMSWDDHIFELLKFILPSVVVFLTVFYVLKQYFESEDKKRRLDIRQSNQKAITPLRLQSYERLVLFLERISPENLVIRMHKNGMSGKLMHSELLKTIRSEFEHNLSQQVYVSNGAWDLVKQAKEETIKLINLSASQVNDDATGMDLSQAILHNVTKIGKLPTQVAIEYLKQEVRQFF